MSKDNNPELAAAGCALIILAPIYAVAATVFNGWVFSLIWGWFVVPFLHLPPMPVVIAIGASCLAACLSTPAYIKGEYTQDGGAIILGSFLRPLFILLTAYIAHFYV